MHICKLITTINYKNRGTSVPVYSPPVYSFVISPTFVVTLILSFLILSSFVTPHIHRSILISATSNLFSCALFNAHSLPDQCWSYHCNVGYVHFPLDLYVHSSVAQHSTHCLPILPPAFHYVGAASSSPSFANVDPRYVNVFTLFTVSVCKWISAIDVHCTPSIQSSFY